VIWAAWTAGTRRQLGRVPLGKGAAGVSAGAQVVGIALVSLVTEAYSSRCGLALVALSDAFGPLGHVAR